MTGGDLYYTLEGTERPFLQRSVTLVKRPHHPSRLDNRLLGISSTPDSRNQTTSYTRPVTEDMISVDLRITPVSDIEYTKI